jgi:predicted RNA-binding protein with PUA-like domain
VDIQAMRPFVKPVTLGMIKAEPALADMALVRSARLSVQPVKDTEWQLVCGLGKTAV